MVSCFQKNEILQSEIGGSPMVSRFQKKWNWRYTTNGVISPGVVLLCWCRLLCATLRGRRQPEDKIGFVFHLFSISILNQTTPDAKCIRSYRLDIKPVWVRCSGNCFPVQACKKIISNKTVRFVSGKSLHFVGILQAWKTSILSKTNLPQGGTQKISKKAKERKTHYQILRGLQRPTLPLHLQN